MVFKNRLDDLRTAAQQQAGNADVSVDVAADENEMLLQGEGANKPGMNKELSEFLELSTEVRLNLKRMDDQANEYMENVEQLRSSSKKTSEGASANLTKIEKDNKLAMEKVNSHLKNIDGQISRREEFEKSENPDLKSKSTVLRVMINMYMSLGKRFKECVQSFAQATAMKDLIIHDNAKRVLTMIGGDTSEESIQKVAKMGNQKVLVGSLLEDQKADVAKVLLADAEEQRDKIKQILEALQHLRQLVVDLAVLVDKQGALLDQIESNCNDAKEYIIEGNVQMGEAKEYERAAAKKKCILIGIIVIVIVVVIIVIVAYLGMNGQL